MNNEKKRDQRKLKREIKKAGSRKRRANLKRDLRENPEEAPFSEIRYGRNSSSQLNGFDRDPKRKRQEEE